MAKIDISTRTPGIFKTNRRKCGWGAALTPCDICGRPMMGHNRGVCSFSRHACKRDLANDARTLALAGTAKRNAKEVK